MRPLLCITLSESFNALHKSHASFSVQTVEMLFSFIEHFIHLDIQSYTLTMTNLQYIYLFIKSFMSVFRYLQNFRHYSLLL